MRLFPPPPPLKLLSLLPQFRTFNGKGVIIIPCLSIAQAWNDYQQGPMVPRNMVPTVKRPSLFDTTTCHSERLRKAVLRLRQVRQMDCCSSLKLCISRSTGQITAEWVLRGYRRSTLKQ